MEKFELRTTLSIQGGPPEAIWDAEQHFKDAFIVVGREYPGIDAFYVTADPEHSELEIGIRFEGIKERYAEEVANEILEKVFDEMAKHPMQNEPSLERESSLLIPA